MFTIKGANVLIGLLTNRTRKRYKIIRASIRLFFIVYFKCNILSIIIIIYFIK
jgi:hypothetical protein